MKQFWKRYFQNWGCSAHTFPLSQIAPMSHSVPKCTVTCVFGKLCLCQCIPSAVIFEHRIRYVIAKLRVLIRLKVIRCFVYRQNKKKNKKSQLFKVYVVLNYTDRRRDHISSILRNFASYSGCSFVIII